MWRPHHLTWCPRISLANSYLSLVFCTACRYYVYNGSVLDSTYLLASLTEEDLSHPDVLHATQVWCSVL